MKGKRFLFYLLSFTWGLPLSLVGLVTAGFLLATGHRPEKHGPCFFFRVGKKPWGGLEMGPVFLTDQRASEHIRNHECGHGFQNCLLGPFMILLVTIPSAVRYWVRHFQAMKGKVLGDYDAVWFEGGATRWGEKYAGRFRKEESPEHTDVC